MKILDALIDALQSLKSNTLRSVLTTLGIIIGVGAVIIMVSVGNGAKEKINAMIDNMGANLMMVTPGRSFGRGVSGSTGTLPTLTEDDARAIADEISAVSLTAPMVRGNAQLVAGNANWSTSVYGITNAFLEARQWAMASGRAFDPEDINKSSKVVLLGKTVADNLFPVQTPSAKRCASTGCLLS